MPRVMMLTRAGLGLIAATLAAIAVAACTPQPAPCAAASRPWPTLRIAVANPRINPVPARKAFSSELLTDLPIVRIDPQGRPMAGLASAWERTDARTWTFTLRPNLRSHTGLPLTPEVIRQDILDRVKVQWNGAPVWRDLRAIETTPTTLVFRFVRPVSMLPQALNVLVLTPRDSPALSAGPFRITHETHDTIDFEAFPAPAPGEARVARLHVDLFPSIRAAYAAFLRNETDFLYEVPPSAISLLSQNPDIHVYGSDHRRVALLEFNMAHRWLRDARVRQAINLAVDRDDVVRRLYGGNLAIAAATKPLVGVFSPEYWATEGLPSKWRSDLPAARALLKAATQGRDEPIEFACLTSSEYPDIAELGTLLEAQLQRVHIRMRLDPQPYETYIKRIESGDYDAFVGPAQAGYGGMLQYYAWHSGGRAAGYYRDIHYNSADAALDRLYDADSPEAERAAVRDVINAMYEDPPAAFLAPVQVIRAVRSTWRVPTDWPDIRRSLSRWQFDPPCRAS
jgi:peptide/nickel transport system substrate-binding protein